MTASAAAVAATAAPAPAHGGGAAKPAQQQHGSFGGCDIRPAMAAMAAAVQSYDFAAAEAAGAAAPLNLALPRAAFTNRRPLSSGAQAAVDAAELRPARLVASVGEGALEGLEGGADGALPVAVKRAVIREAPDLERFRREAALLAALRGHPHVARLLGARMLPPDYCLVLQLEAGTAEAALHEAGWRPSWPELLRLGAQLAGAAAALHALGFVHRDIKPANVLLNAARDHARLADLGLAAAADELSARGLEGAKPSGGFHRLRLAGTLEYMPPEVLLGSAPHSPAADVYALAVTLNELATGALPFSDCTRDNPLAHTVLEMGYGRQELAAAVAAEGLRPTLAPDTPAAVQALLRRCWHADPAQRPSAAQLASELAAAAADAQAAEAAGSPARRASAPALLPTPQPTRVGPRRLDSDDADMADAELAGSSPSSSECSSPLAGGAAAAAVAACGLPSWLAAAAGGGSAAAGASYRSAQHAGGTGGGSGRVHVGSFLSAGRRDNMEDTVAVLPDAFAGCVPDAPACTALGVFDGHRGAAAADYLAAQLPAHLAAALPSSGSAPALLAATLADADAAFRARQEREWAARVARVGAAAAGARPWPGATATLLLVYPAPAAAPQQQQEQQQLMLAVANLGDSRVVLCRDGQAVQLTRDHTADLPDERARVAAAGGACSVRAGGWRVGEAGLQVTRSVGDADLKAQGVSAEAEAHELALQPGDSFLIAATDGLWDRMSNEEAVALVQDTVKQPAMCAQRLVTEALGRGGTDNVACLVAFLGSDGATAERVFHQGRLKYASSGAARHAAAAVSADELRDTY